MMLWEFKHYITYTGPGRVAIILASVLLEEAATTHLEFSGDMSQVQDAVDIPGPKASPRAASLALIIIGPGRR